MKVAIVATVKDEVSDIGAFLQAIELQTRKPDMVVIVDGGSKDGTWAALRAWDWGDRANVETLIMLRPCNRSRGRNMAADLAMKQGAEVLAFTNVSEPLMSWLDVLVRPIEGGLADMVGGSWLVNAHGTREAAMALLTQFTSDQLDISKISALNMAITADAFKHVGGFDPDLDTSEDTDFTLAADALGVKMAFEPKAVVVWRPATLTLRGAVKTYYQFAMTDGKARLMSDQYVLTYLAYLMFPLLPVWLLLRVRKVLRARLLRQVPLALAAAVAMDVARMVGYARGRLGR